jgi:hypothetical protein
MLTRLWGVNVRNKSLVALILWTPGLVFLCLGCTFWALVYFVFLLDADRVKGPMTTQEYLDGGFGLPLLTVDETSNAYGIDRAVHYYFDNGSELETHTYFLRNSADTPEIAAVIYQHNLSSAGIEPNARQLSLERAQGGDGYTCSAGGVRSTRQGDFDAETCIQWFYDRGVSVYVYSVFSEAETIEFINALEQLD